VIVLVEQQARDQVAAEEKEYRDAESARYDLSVTGMGRHHDQHRYGTDAVQGWDRLKRKSHLRAHGGSFPESADKRDHVMIDTATEAGRRPLPQLAYRGRSVTAHR
jgi:hypothetical protein